MRRLPGILAFACLASLPAVTHGDDVFGASGFSSRRDYFRQLPYEQVDPLTGNLILTFTDLVLPGNAGFELRVERTYNSKIYRDYESAGDALGEDSWAGVGWTLHFGRVFHAFANDATPPVIEMSDGSRHPSYRHLDGSGRFITRDFWIYERRADAGMLRLPNGVVYTFAHATLIGHVPGGTALYVTRIQDRFGNRIDLEYAAGAAAPPDALSRITQVLGGAQARTVTFTYDPGSGSIATMSFAGRTWRYASAGAGSVGYSLLTGVTPPVGAGWSYSYNTAAVPRYELTRLATPQGGTIDYGYGENAFFLGASMPVRQRVLLRRTTGGRGIAAGTWTYSYPTGDGTTSTVSAPCRTTTYGFLGVGRYATPGKAWQVGLRSSRAVADASGELESEQVEWQSLAAISNEAETVGFNHDPAIYVPLPALQTIRRGGRSYTTRYRYDGERFNDYGRPNRIEEAGELSRTITRVFDYDFSFYAADKLSSETVSGGESFTTSYTYDRDTGFRTSQSVHGVTTTFGDDGRGNVASVTDANGNTTRTSYSWGVAEDATTPEYTILRTVDSDGTVAAETRRGLTTRFEYDALARLIRTIPPIGNATAVEYDDDGTFMRTVRGSAAVTTSLDGFGRPTGTSDSAGVKTALRYDACGRRSYESYRFTGANLGTAFAYDGLDRLTRRTHTGDGAHADHRYTGLDVEITDENGHSQRQDWSAFGDPAQARLTGLRDAAGQTTSYTYNVLGSLRSVEQPGVPARTWTYNARNELVSERHPESGVVSYTYDAAGNVRTRSDAAFGTTTFEYDGNGRLSSVDRPGDADDLTLAYDDADNRTLASSAAVTSRFVYDDANRLTARSDRIGELELATGYTYDGNDGLVRITYPSGRIVTYSRDAIGRITAVGRPGEPGFYARRFEYHPSGAPASFVAGNGQLHAFTYDTRYRIASLAAGTPLQLTYRYDDAGNVTEIDEPGRSGMDQSFGYDVLDRLVSARGFWGSGSYTYSAAGNRLSSSVGGPASYTYDQATQRLSSGAGQSFGYDANGNTSSDAAGSYAYTPSNRLAAASVGGATVTYRYDGDDLRTQRVAGGDARYYVHGPGGLLLGEYTDSTCGGGAALIRDYVYAGSRLLATVAVMPTLAVRPAPAVDEAAGAAAVAVEVVTPDGCPLTTDVSVAYRSEDGTARAGSDYEAVAGTLAFPRGTPSGSAQVVAVPILNDHAIEPDEAFRVVLSAPSGATIGGGAQAVTVHDNDTPELGFAGAAAARAGEDGRWLGDPLRVSVRTADGNALPAEVRVRFATANGSAAAGSDYAARSGVLSFAAGTPSGSAQPLDLVVLQDAAAEADETFRVLLSAPQGATLAGSAATVTIVDDEPSLSLAPAAARVGEQAGTATVAVRLALRPAGPSLTASPVSVTLSTVAGTATAADFTAVASRLTFPAGSADGAVIEAQVPIVNDTRVEADEVFQVRLASPAGARLAEPASQAITILDDEPMLSFRERGSSVSEAVEGGRAAVEVTLRTRPGMPAVTASAVSAAFATANGSALAGSDYTASAGRVSFPAGSSDGATRTIEIPITDDAIAEADEALSIRLTGPAEARLEGQTTHTLTIVSDDPAPSLSVADAVVVEGAPGGGASLAFTVTLSTPSAQPAVVRWATADGTAQAGRDYSARAGALTIPAGAVSRTVTVPVIGDVLDEPDEVVLLQLAEPAGAVLGRARAQGTIADDDGPPSLCRPVLLLPYTIASPGSYCLAADAAAGGSLEAAITIDADGVVLDLGGHALDGSAGGGAGPADGIVASARSQVAVRNGIVRGFRRGIVLEAPPPYAASTGNRVEDVLAEGNAEAGIVAAGSGLLLQRNRVTGAGAPAEQDVDGIVAFGPGARVLDNDVVGVATAGEGVSRGIRVEAAPGARVCGNRIAGGGLLSTGIAVGGSAEVLVCGNRVTGADSGVVYDAESTGEHRDNLTSGVGMPYMGGSEGGNDQ